MHLYVIVAFDTNQQEESTVRYRQVIIQQIKSDTVPENVRMPWGTYARWEYFKGGSGTEGQ